MEIYKFSKETGKDITQYHSNFIMTCILKTEGISTVGCMHLDQEGVIGYHQATVDQLFLVVSGEGFVRSEDTDFISVEAGDAVFWAKGEWHETKSDKGLTAIVIESNELKPAQYMQKN